jgi:hypothetical protein
MTQAKIYKPTKTVTQSGHAKDYWVLEFISDDRKYSESLMGWIGSKDTKRQLILKFNNLEEAKEYAEKNHLDFFICKQSQHKIKPKSYSDNFK